MTFFISARGDVFHEDLECVKSYSREYEVVAEPPEDREGCRLCTENKTATELRELFQET